MAGQRQPTDLVVMNGRKHLQRGVQYSTGRHGAADLQVNGNP